MTTEVPPTLGVILAGGLARRMGGGDKALIDIAGKTILERAVVRIAPQCRGLIINANGDTNRFSAFGFATVSDDIPDFAGPLAGILAALDWAAANEPSLEWVLSVPGDCPFLPGDLVRRLHAARIAQAKPLACAKSGDWRHPVVGLWDVALRADLRHALTVEHLHKIEIWTARHGVAIAEWSDRPVDPFFNVNSPADRDRAIAIARAQGA